MRPTRNKAAQQANEKLVYPPNCKEISEDLSTDDLVRRLKEISMAFQQLSQDDDNSQYIPLALTLTNDFYLEHSSKDVRLLVACSIADVFRVYAPNAPYENDELIKKIFKFFIQQLKGLQDPKLPTFKRYFYLLENLAWVKSFNICIELEDSQAIFGELFSLIFSIVNENHSEKVKNFMVDVLTPLIQESDATSPELMEIIFIQLIEPKKSQAKHACLLAREIIKRSIKTLGPYLVNYLATAVTSEVNPNGDETLDSNSNSHKTSTNSQTASYFRKNIIGICDLIYELNKVVPETMRDFLPQLEYKIKSNEDRERCEYTRLLARLFSDKDSNLANDYPELWKCFLGRFKDISATVRIRCVQYSMHFLVNHPGMKPDVTEQLKQRLHDPDENVRHEVVMAIISAARKGMDNINVELIHLVQERALDKKFKIRREALYGIAQLYRQYVLNMKPEGPQPTTDDGINSIKELSWIKDHCLYNYYQNSLEDKLLVERIVHTCLVPCALPLEERVRTLYTFYVTINIKAAKAFNEMLRQQQLVRKQVFDILEVMKDPSGAAKDGQLKQKVQICSRSLLEPVKTEEYILKLVGNLENNNTLRDHLELIVSSADPNCHDDKGNFIPPPPCTAIEQSVREILRSLGYPVQTNSFYMIIKNLMERIAPIMIDHEGILQLFSYVSDSLIGDGEIDSKLGVDRSPKRGLELILSFAHVFPTLFHGKEPYNGYLLPFLWLQQSDPKVGELVLQILAAIGKRPFPKYNNSDSALPYWAQSSNVIRRIIDNCILEASSPKQAKYAILCLNSVISTDQKRDEFYGQILDSIKEAGLSLDTGHFRAHLVALGMIATCGGQIKYPAVLKSIINRFVVQGLIMKDTRTDIEIKRQEESEAKRPLVAFDKFDYEASFSNCSEEIKCKIEGIKLIVRWIHGMKLSALSNPENTDLQTKYAKTANNLLQLCKTIIQNGGDLNENGLAGTTFEKAHLRLAAANAMIRIVANDSIVVDKPSQNNLAGDNAETKSDNIVFKKAPSSVSNLIGPQQLHILATTLIDTQEFVREIFTLKLYKKLIGLELGLEFLAIFSLGGKFSQESAFRKKLQTYLLNNLTKRRELIKANKAHHNLHPDCTMPFVIHLLAHMPFYTRYDDTDQLEIVKECLWFIMEPMVFKNENYSFTFFKKTFESIKTCIDKTTAPEDDSPLSPSAQLINYKIYCACDLALGLVMSKTQNFALKESPIRPQLHSRYYTKYKALVENNHKCYLPESMQFPPPKRCGLETEILGKTNKKVKKG